MDGSSTLLASVSRSFYLSMRFLPGGMREAVGCAYLLARATDTVADSPGFPVDERLALLAQMRRLVLEGGTPDDSAVMELRDRYAPSIDHAGERELLARFGECLGLMAALPEAQQALIRTVLGTIIDGQSWDLGYFSSHQRVDTTGELDLYTYRVAGCVGEFWTDLGFLCEGEGFALLPAEDMRAMGRLYGQGLQLVNILRDRNEDAANGRSYVPGEASPWFGKARNGLLQGVAYAEALRGLRLRFATVMPAWLGLKTLDLVETSDAGKPKIRRRAVYATLVRALAFAARPAQAPDRWQED